MRTRPSRSRGGVAEDPLQTIKKAVVAIGQVSSEVPSVNKRHQRDDVGATFDVRGTGFLYSYTPIEFAEGKSQPDPKTGAVYYWATIWIVTCKHCLRGIPIIAVRMDTKSGGTRVYTFPSAKWFMHPTEDVAVTPLTLARRSVATCRLTRKVP